MTILRKIAALLLVSIYMLSATVTREFLKLPLLAEHFYHHQSENRGIDLLGFLVQHYFLEDGTDKDAAEDSRLPFKSADQLTSFMCSSLIPPSFIQLPAGITGGPDKKFYTLDQLILTTGFLGNIWQPPRHLPAIA